MRRRWIRDALLGVSGVALAGSMVLAPTGVQAATGDDPAVEVAKVAPGKPGAPGKPDKPGKPGDENPCLDPEKPAGKPGEKPAGKPADKIKAEDPAKTGDKLGSNGKAEAKPGDKGEKKPGDKGKPVGVLVCGDIAEIGSKHGRDALVLKTVKGPVTVLMTRETVIIKDGVEQPRKVLQIGLSVAVKGEVSKNGTVKALGILLV